MTIIRSFVLHDYRSSILIDNETVWISTKELRTLTPSFDKLNQVTPSRQFHLQDFTTYHVKIAVYFRVKQVIPTLQDVLQVFIFGAVLVWVGLHVIHDAE